MIEVVDAIDRQVRLARPPERVVSLVPSETASVADLLGVERLVGRTDYCVEPANLVETIPSVGGTKSLDVDLVKALQPDLVLANKEENSRPLVQALIAAGLTVHVSFPCTADESLAYLESLAILLGVDPKHSESVNVCRRVVQRAYRATPAVAVPVFVPIWKGPGMKVQQRDTRYPRIRLQEVVERGARAVLLPDEPYAFGTDDLACFADLDASPPLRVELVDGKDLFWYGTRMAGAIERLRVRVERLRSVCFGASPNN